ncbi:MAG: hypothetical protein JO316_02210 [Abitibacteriaceae bacterium]|nr:hypothetical protein [Abditibacteriaceae bacterium]
MIQTDLAIGLINPKFPHNVGAAVRAASCYGASHLFYTGDRIDEALVELKRLPREERMKGYRDVKWQRQEKFLELFDADIVPVAVELRPQAETLFDFVHPPRAVYIFGPEDGSLEPGILASCHRFIVIPTAHCLNLAAAVNVVLYDRTLKQHLSKNGLAWWS